MYFLLNGNGVLVTKAMEEAEVLNAFFTSVFTCKTRLRESRGPESNGKVWSKEDLEEEGEIKEY